MSLYMGSFPLTPSRARKSFGFYPSPNMIPVKRCRKNDKKRSLTIAGSNVLPNSLDGICEQFGPNAQFPNTGFTIRRTDSTMAPFSGCTSGPTYFHCDPSSEFPAAATAKIISLSRLADRSPNIVIFVATVGEFCMVQHWIKHPTARLLHRIMACPLVYTLDEHNCILLDESEKQWYILDCTKPATDPNRVRPKRFTEAVERAIRCKSPKIILDEMHKANLRANVGLCENYKQMMREGKTVIMNARESEEIGPCAIIGAVSNIRTNWQNELSYLWLPLDNGRRINAIDVEIKASDQDFGLSGPSHVNIVLRDSQYHRIISFPLGIVTNTIKCFTFGSHTNGEDHRELVEKARLYPNGSIHAVISTMAEGSKCEVYGGKLSIYVPIDARFGEILTHVLCKQDDEGMSRPKLNEDVLGLTLSFLNDSSLLAPERKMDDPG